MVLFHIYRFILRYFQNVSEKKKPEFVWAFSGYGLAALALHSPLPTETVNEPVDNIRTCLTDNLGAKQRSTVPTLGQ